MEAEKRAQPRRQARGTKRIDSALNAAAEVFAEIGIHAATTNAIAARAGMSPGSLYQFFPNKAAIADALAARYIAELQLVHEEVFRTGDRDTPLGTLVERVVDPLIAFNVRNPSFEALLADPSSPARESLAEHPLHAAVLSRVEDLLAARLPHIEVGHRRRMSQIVVQVFKGVLPLVMAAEIHDRAYLIEELKCVLLRYLQPMDVPGVGPE